jgi:hypothetical protein
LLIVTNKSFKFYVCNISVFKKYDLDVTNYKFKEHICYIKNLKDLFVANVKLKRLICNLKTVNDLSVTNVKLKRHIDIFEFFFKLHLTEKNNPKLH